MPTTHRNEQRVNSPFRRALVATFVLAIGLPTSAVILPVPYAAAAPPAGACTTTTGTTTISGTINTYAAGLYDESPGSTVLETQGFVNGSFAAGDRVLIIQMQDAVHDINNNFNYGAGNGTGRGVLDIRHTGRYEFRAVTAVSGSTLTVTPGISREYRNGDGLSRKAAWQIVRVPVYRNVSLSGTVSALSWNGNVGGVVAFQALGTVTTNGHTIEANGRGFRPGAWMQGGNPSNTNNPGDFARPAGDLFAEKGEGYVGTPNGSYSATAAGYDGGSFAKGAPGNAGGGGNNHNSGGGGGGGNGQGGQGGRGWTIWNNNTGNEGGYGGEGRGSNSDTWFLGGGGGQGHYNGYTNTGQGGAGGGIVFVTANSFSGGGTLSANANNGASAGDDGAGGGGGGGTIIVGATAAGSALGGLNMNARGGHGGNTGHSSQYLGPGGGGGGGRIIVHGSGMGAYNASPGFAGTIPWGTTQSATNGGSGAFSEGQSWIAGLQPVECDYGDGPASYGDPTHTLTTTPTNSAVLRIGSVSPDAEISITRGWAANGDDTTGTNDEDGIGTPPTLSAGQSTYSITVPVANTTGASATLVGWVDADRNGSFSSGEGTSTTVANGATSATLTWTGLNPVAGTSLIRLRLAPATSGLTTSTTSNHVVGGEVEDHPLTIVASADLSISQSAPATAAAGAQYTYTLNITNNGPGSASSVSVTDTLPAGVTFVSASGGCTHSAGNVTCNLGTLASGATSSPAITVAVPVATAAGTTLSNTASVTSSTNDPNGANNSSTASTTVSLASDVSVGLTAPATATAGSALTYTLTATNGGPSNTSSVSIALPVPAGTTFASGGSGCTQSDGTVTCNLGSLNAGATASRNVTVNVGAGVGIGSTLTATATLTAANDSTPGNNTASATSTVQGSADLAGTLAGPGSVIAGNQITYTVGASNTGPSNATSVSVALPLPSGVTFSSASAGCTHAAGTVTCTSASLAAGASTTWTVTATVASTVASGTTLSATATASSATSDPDPANNASPAVATTVTTSADVGITVSGPATGNAGTQAAFTMQVTNHGPSRAAGVVATMTLPAGMTFLSASGCTHGNGVVTCSIGTQNAGAVVNRTVNVTLAANIGAGAALAVSASVTASTSDPQPTNNTAGTTFTATNAADLVAGLAGAGTAVAGGQLTYTLSATNNGPSDATNATMTFPVPAGVTFVSATGGCSHSAGTVTCALGTVGAGTTVNRTVTVAIPPDFEDGGQISATLTVGASTDDPNPANNTATTTATGTATADLAVITSGPGTIHAGSTAHITFTATNNGPSDSGTFTITAPLPAGAQYVSGDAGCSPAGGTITCAVDNLPAGANVGRTVVLGVAAATTPGTALAVSASVSGGVDDPVPANNTAPPLNLTVTATADLSVTLAAVASVVAGTNATYLATVANDGPSDATGSTVTLQLPEDVSVAALPGGCTADGDTVTCAIGTLAAGASTTRSIEVTVAPSTTPGTVLGATATVEATTADAAPGNNTSATTVTTVTGSADLSILATGPVTATAGATAQVTLTVANAGPSDALGVTAELELPAGTALAAAPAGCTAAAGTVTCTIGALAAGASAARTLTLAIDPSVADGDQRAFTATTASTTPEADPNDNTAPVLTIDIIRRADLVASKTATPTADAGTTATYSIGVTNLGPSDATAPTITDPLPVGATLLSVDPGCAEDGGIVSCSADDLGVGDSATFEVQVTLDAALPAGSTVTNAVTVTSDTVDPVGANNTATASTGVTSTADLALTLAAPATASAGGRPVLTLTIANAGPSDTAGPTVRIPLPPGTAFHSGDAGCAADGDDVLCEFGPVAAGATATAEVTVALASDLPHGATVSFTGTVATASTDPDPTNDADTATLQLENVTDLLVSGSGPATVTAGTQATFTYSVANDGPADAGGVRLTIPLPAGSALIGGDGCTEDDGIVTCTIGDLAVGEGSILAVTVGIAPDVDPGAVLVHEATVSSDTTDTLPQDDAWAVETEVVTSADLAITKSGPPEAVAGTTVDYVISVTNSGPSEARGVVATDVLPAGGTFVSATGGCVEDDGIVTCPLGTVAPGDLRVMTIRVFLDADYADGGLLLNTASVAADTDDPDPTDNLSGTVSTSVVAVADLAVDITADPDAVAGGTYAATYTVSNAGPSLARGVVVTVPLPGGVTVEHAPGCVETDGALACTLGDLAAGAGASGGIVLRLATSIAAGTTIWTTAAVASDAEDPRADDDTAEAAATLVDALADLGVTVVAPSTATAGTDLTAEVTIVNLGPSDAEAVRIVLPRPAHTGAPDALPAGCTFDGDDVTCEPGHLAAGDDLTITLTFPVDGTAPDGATVDLEAAVTTDTADPDPANDHHGPHQVTVRRESALTAQLAGPDTATAGTTATYSLTLTNNGPSAAGGAEYRLTLPNGMQATATSPDCTVNGPLVTCAAGELAAAGGWSGTVEVLLAASVADGTALALEGEVRSDSEDPDATDDTATHTTVVAAEADLRVQAQAPATARAGDVVITTATVTNDGPSDAVGVTLSRTFPAGWNVVGMDGTCTATPDSAGTLVTCTIGTVPAGGDVTLTLTTALDAELAAGTTLETTTAVAADTADPDPSNDEATTTLALETAADLAVAIGAGGEWIAGAGAHPVVTVTHGGPSTARGAVLTLTLGAGLSVAPGDDSGCTDDGDGTLTCALGELDPGAVRTVVPALVLDPSLGRGTEATITAAVVSDTADPDTTNNLTDLAAVIDTRADLSVLRTVDATGIAGSTIGGSVTVTNHGPSDATDVTVTVPLPAGATLAGDHPDCVGEDGEVRCTIGGLAAGAATTIAISLALASTLADGTESSHTATVASATDDPDADNDTAPTVTSFVTTLADLRMEVDAPDTVTAGTTGDVTYTVTNHGPSTALGVTALLVGGIGTSLDTADVRCTEGDDEEAGTFTCTLGDLAVGASAAVTATLRVLGDVADGAVVTTDAVAAAATTEATPSDNHGSAGLGVDTAADLRVTKAGPTAALAGDTITYTLTIVNLGPSSARNVVLGDVLPEGTTFVAADPGCTLHEDEPVGEGLADVVRCAVDPLAAGSTLERNITLRADATLDAGTGVLNVATVSSTTFDPETDNNSGAAEPTVLDTAADLSVVAVAPDDVTAGRAVAIDVTVTNAGPSEARAVVVTGVLPEGLDLLDGGDCTADGTSGGYRCEVGDLAAGATATIVVDARVATSAPAGSVLPVSAAVAADTEDPDPANDTAPIVNMGVLTETDLALTVSAPATATAGRTATVLLGLTNAGPSDAAATTVTVTLPPGTSLEEGDPACVDEGDGTVSCTFGTLTATATRYAELVLVLDPALTPGAVLELTAVAATTTTNLDPAEDTATASITVAVVADLAAGLMGPANVTAGTNATYLASVANAGPSAATDVVLSLPLPAGTTLASADPGCTVVDGAVHCLIDALAPGATADRIITLAVDPSSPDGTVLATAATAASATVDPEADNDGSAPVTTTVGTLADLAITIDGPATVTAGATATSTVTITNTGPSDAADVVVSGVLPPGATLTGGDCTVVDGVILCPVGTLAPGATATITVELTFAANLTDVDDALATLTVVAATADPDPSDNSASTVVTSVATVADLAATLDAPAVATAGRTTTVPATATNLGPSDAVDATITLTVPPGVTITGGDCTGTGPAICELGTLPAGAAAAVAVTLAVDAAVGHGTELEVTATVASATTDAEPGNDESTATITAAALADLAIALDTEAAATAGTTTAATYTVTNAGPSDAVDIVITETLPAGVTLVAADPGCSVADGTLTCTIDTLAAGGTLTRSATVALDPALDPAGVLARTASVTAATADDDPTNNLTAVTITDVDAAADLSISLDVPADAVAGTALPLTVTVTNAGPSDAREAAVAVPTAPGTTPGDLPDGCLDAGGTVVCDLGTLAAGEQRTLDLSRTVDSTTAPGAITHTASVAAGTPDPDAMNDEAGPHATEVSTEADLDVVVSTDAATVRAGDSIGITVLVHNAGPSDAVGVEVRPELPAGLSLGDTIVGTIAAGDVATVTYSLLVPAATPAGTTIDVGADVAADTADPALGNNRATPTTVTVTTEAGLSASVSGPVTVVAGTTATYRAAVANAGPSDAAEVAITVPLPAGATATDLPEDCTTDGAAIACALGALAAGEARAVDLTWAVAASVPAGTLLEAVATVTSSTPDPDGADDTAIPVVTTVTTLAGLAATVAAGDTAIAGTTTWLTLGGTNAGPSDAVGTVVSTLLPTGVAFVSGPDGCTEAAGFVHCEIGTLAAGTSADRTITVAVAADRPAGSEIAVASAVASDTADPDAADDESAATTITITAEAALAVQLAGPAAVTAGTTTDLTATVSNAGPSDAAAATVTFEAPGGFTPTTLPAGCTSDGAVVTCALGTVAANDAVAVTITVHVDPALPATPDGEPGPTATATVSSPTDPTDGGDSHATVVETEADLSVGLTAAAAAVAGRTFVAQASLANDGPSDALDARLDIGAPDGATVTAADLPGGSCTPTPTGATCTLDRLAAGASVTAALTLAVDAATVDGTILLTTATVASATADPVAANDEADPAATAVTAAADLAVEVEAPATALAGTDTTYRITVTNAGPSAAVDTTATLALPVGTTLSDADPGCSAIGSTVVCGFGTLAVDGTAEANLTVRVAPSVTAGTALVATATVAATTLDPEPEDNIAPPVTTEVTALADLGTTLTGPTEPVAGTTATYIVTVTNAGPSDATGVVVTLPAPPGITLEPGGPCTLEEGVIRCVLDTVAEGTTATVALDLSIAPDLTEPIGLATSTTATTPDPDAEGTDAAGAITMAVTAAADVAVIHTAPATATAGTTATWTTHVTNHGPSTARAVTVDLPLPAGTTLAGGDPRCALQAEPGGGATVRCLLGDLDPGTTAVAIELALDAALAEGTTIATAVTSAHGTPDGDPANDDDAATVTVGTLADLTVTAAPAPPATAGGTATTTLTVTNAGPSVARDVLVLHALPAGLSFGGAVIDPDTGAACAEVDGVVVCDLGDLDPGGAVVVTLTFAVAADLTEDPVTSASVTSPTPDPSPADNTTGDLVTSLLTSADLHVTLTAPDSVTAGTTTTFTLTVTNHGPSDARNVVVTDTLPEGLVVLDPPEGCVVAGGVLTCIVERLATGDTVALAFDAALHASVPASTPLLHTVTVSSDEPDPDPTNNTAGPVDTAVDALADLHTTVSVPGSVTAGDTAAVIVTIDNDGPSDATGVRITLPLPPGTSFHGADADCAVVDGPDGTGATVVCELGTVADGATRVVTILVALDADLPDGTALALLPAVTADTPDPDPGDDQAPPAPVTVTTLADLAAALVGPADAVAGESVRFQAMVTNAGPSDARNVTVTIQLPVGITWDSGDPACTAVPGTVACELTAIPAGDTVVLEVVGLVDVGVADGAVLATAAGVAADTVDPNPTDNMAAAVETTVRAAANLSITATGPTTVTAGDTHDVILTVDNRGPSTATGVIVTAAVPPGAGVESASVDLPEADCIVTTGPTVTCTIGSVIPGATPVVHLVLRVAADLDPGTTVVTTAMVAADTWDPDPTDDTAATPAAAVLTSADLAASLDAPATVDAGTTMDLVLGAANAGPSDARGASLAGPLPAGVTVVGGDAGCIGTEAGYSCALGTIAAGDTVTRTLTVMVGGAVDPGTVLATTATVTADTADPDAGDDTAGPTATTVTTRADLSATLAGPAQVVAGTEATLVVTVANAGPSDARDATITVPLDAATSFVTAAVPCVAGPANLVCSVPLVAAGSATAVEMRLLVDAATPAGTELNHDALVAHAGDPEPDNDASAVLTTTVTTVADLAVELTGPTTLTAGALAGYTVTITNAGPSDAVGVTLTNHLPPGAVPAFDDPSCAATAETISCAVGPLAAGASVTRTLTLRLDPALADATPVNQVVVDADTADPDTTNNEAAVGGVPVAGLADLAVVATGPAAVTAGTTGMYAVTVANAGPSEARDVVVTAPLPAGVTLVASTDGCVEDDGTLVCTLGTLDAGSHAGIWFSVAVPAGTTDGTLTLHGVAVTSSTPDPNPADNTGAAADTSIETSADLDAAVTAPAGATAGGTVTVSVDVSNSGPSDARGVVLGLPLPDGTAMSGGSPFCTVVDGTALCALGTVGAGSTRTVTVTLSVDPAVAAGTVLVLGPFVGSDTADPDGLVVDPAEVTITTAADVSVHVAASAPPVAGETATDRLSITNDGPSVARDVVVTVLLPAGTAAVDDAGCITVADATVLCTVGNVPAGGSVTVELVTTTDATVPAGTTLATTATVAASTSDPDPAGNMITWDRSVRAVADLSVALAGPVEVVAGATAEVVVSVTNRGPSHAVGVRVDALLPSGTGVERLDDRCTVADRVVSCTIEALEVGATVDLDSVLTIDPALASGATVDLQAQVHAASEEPTDAADDNAADDNAADDNAATHTMTVATVADLTVTAALPAIVIAGAGAELALEVSNAGPSHAADVTVEVALPEGMSAGSSTVPCVGDGGALRCTVGSLAAGATAPITVAVVAAADLDPATTLTVDLAAASTTPDPDPSGDAASAETVVDTLADVELTMDGPAQVLAGSTMVQVLTATNAGPSEARGVMAVLRLPAGVTVTTPPTGCTLEGDTLTCDLGTIATGGATTVSVTSRVEAGLAEGTALSLNASASSTTPDPDGDGPVAEPAVALVSTGVDLAASISGPATLHAGAAAPITVTVDNRGPSTARGATVRITTPDGAALASGASGCTEADGALTCALGDLDADTSVAVTVDLRPAAGRAGTPVTVTAAGESITPELGAADNDATRSFPVTGRADLAVVATAPTTVDAGATLRVDLGATNNGPSDAVASVVTLRPPAGTTPAGLPAGCVFVGGRIRCELGTLAVGATVNRIVHLSVSPNRAERSVVQADVTATSATSDPNHADNRAAVTATVTTAADLYVVGTVDAAAVAGRPLTYRATVGNVGPSDAAGVAVTLGVPPGFQPEPGAGCERTGAVVRCPVGALVAGGITEVRFTGRVIPSLPEGERLTARLEVGGTTTDPTTTNNSADVSSGSVVTENNASARMEGPSGTVRTGDRLTITVEVANTGAGDLVDVATIQSWPAGLVDAAFEGVAEVVPSGPAAVRVADLPGAPSVAAATASPGDLPSCGVVDSSVRCTVGRLAPATRLVYRISGSVAPDLAPADRMLVSRLLVSAGGREVDVVDNTVTWWVVAEPITDLRVNKTADRDEVRVGDRVNYTLEVTNVGSDTAYDVAVDELMPDALRLIGWTTMQGTFDPAALRWSIPAIPAGATASLAIRTEVVGTGEIVNRVRLAATTNEITGPTISHMAEYRVLAFDQEAAPARLAHTGVGRLIVLGGGMALLVGLLLVGMATRRSSRRIF